MNRLSRVGLVSVICFLFVSCASTGPKVTKAELEKKELEFNQKFFKASDRWLPRVYRVGYQLLKSPLPEDEKQKPQHNFVGIGVDNLEKPSRKVFAIDPLVNGALVRGLYPGSQAEGSGLLAGDVITAVDGKKVTNLRAYMGAIKKVRGEKATIEYWRRNKGYTNITLPVEKVYYNAQFFLSPTPQFDASALFSRIDVGIGALRYCRNDDELAMIMGHELAHVTLNHSAKKLGAGVGMGLAYGTVAGVIDAFTLPGVGQALMTPAQQASQAALSRQYEKEADYHGVQHAFHSGFDIQNGSSVFVRLGSDSPGFQVLAFTMASHPNTPERALRLEKAQEELKVKYPEKQSSKSSENWEIIIPVESGESLDSALDKLSGIHLSSVQPMLKSTASVPVSTGGSVFDDFDFKPEAIKTGT